MTTTSPHRIGAPLMIGTLISAAPTLCSSMCSVRTHSSLWFWRWARTDAPTCLIGAISGALAVV